MIDYPLWKDMGVHLRDHKYQRRYLTPEQYLKDNPLEVLVVPPDIEKFFGTKVLNIFIVGIPYGWEKDADGVWQESWPPEGFDEAVDRHKVMYKKFTRYETHIYMDYNIVQKVIDASSSSRFREMMDATKIHLQDLCTDLTDFGFIMEDDIVSEVDESHFYPVIDEFEKAPSTF